MTQHKITCPVTREQLEPLRAGDTVLLSGTVYTARDAAHKRLSALLQEGKPLPFDVRGAAVYYAGPTPAPEGMPIGACGPTTSGRMDAYAPALMREGLIVMIGKGARSAEVEAAVRETGAVYLAAIGGGGALAADCVQSAELVCYGDLGSEAIRRLTVRDMPLTVVLDAHGGNLYREGPAAYLVSRNA